MQAKIVNNKPKPNRPFPKLMQCNGIEGFIVLLYSSNSLNSLNSRGKGTVVSVGDSKDWSLGEYMEDWSPHLFSDFEGTLELSND